MASTAALKPAVVVMHGIERCTAAVRIAQPSARVPRPTGVLITRSISPALMMSTIVFSPKVPVPSECFLTVVHSIPLVRKNSAVPSWQVYEIQVQKILTLVPRQLLYLYRQVR